MTKTSLAVGANVSCTQSRKPYSIRVASRYAQIRSSVLCQGIP